MALHQIQNDHGASVVCNEWRIVDKLEGSGMTMSGFYEALVELYHAGCIEIVWVAGVDLEVNHDNLCDYGFGVKLKEGCHARGTD